jgi:4-alpha-glucanotransferase
VGALRAYAAERGVRLIGDVPSTCPTAAPITTAGRSCSPAARSPARRPTRSARPASAGSPLYDWPVHRATGFHWWRERFRRTLELVDLTRIDHFRGFVSYWAIPARKLDGEDGRWRRPGPRRRALSARSSKTSGTCLLIAEDLGHITPPVYALRDELGLPGMVVLLWAFRRRKRNPHNPRNHRRNSVAYTSTHDTDTAAGWFAALTPSERDATGLDPQEPSWGLISSTAPRRARDRAGARRAGAAGARMNRPGGTGGTAGGSGRADAGPGTPPPPGLASPPPRRWASVERRLTPSDATPGASGAVPPARRGATVQLEPHGHPATDRSRQAAYRSARACASYVTAK